LRSSEGNTYPQLVTVISQPQHSAIVETMSTLTRFHTFP
jgi:hypothetical protein